MKRVFIRSKEFVSIKDEKNALKLRNVIDKTQNLISVDEIESLIFQKQDSYLSTELIVKFLERDIPILFCDEKYRPVSRLAASKDIELLFAQISCSNKMNDRLWQGIVKEKIDNQRACLLQISDKTKSAAGHLLSLKKQVLQGDPKNIEGQAAKAYFSALFGQKFKRGRYDDPLNSALNYGYALLRSKIQQELILAGFEPSIGIHHMSEKNPYNLADDVIEGLRPFIDEIVFREVYLMKASGLTSEIKQSLFHVFARKCLWAGRCLTVKEALLLTVQSLERCYRKDSSKLLVPKFI